MEEIVLRTDVYAPPEEVFAVLRDFPGYAKYSEHLERVEQHGDGGPGTIYEIAVAWWRIGYTARTEVTRIDPNARIEWEVIGRIDADGAWTITPLDGSEDGTRVALSIRYDPSTAHASALDLPRLIPIDWLADRVRPVLFREAEAVVERVVAELEGSARSVELDIQTRHG